jgi:hypothetical protein
MDTGVRLAAGSAAARPETKLALEFHPFARYHYLGLYSREDRRMKRLLPIAIVACAAIAFSDKQGCAQIPVGGPGGSPQYRPAYSPYLNMLRQGGSPTQNYFGLVRPELSFNDSVFGLQQQVGGNQQSINQLQANAVTTGHPAIFMNTFGYFQSAQGGGGAGGGGQGAGGAGGFGGAASFGQGLGGGAGGGQMPGVAR